MSCTYRNGKFRGHGLHEKGCNSSVTPSDDTLKNYYFFFQKVVVDNYGGDNYAEVCISS